MKWFTGSINEAVTTSKSRKAVFVVFVEGRDDTSVQLAQAIDATEISSRLEEEHFVAIKLESGSESYRFFAQIYQLVPVPSLFFIGENGTPLEIVAGSTTATELASKIDNVLLKAGKTNKEFSSNLIDEEKKAAATSSSSNNNAEATTSNINNIETNPETDLTTTIEPIAISSINDEKSFIEEAAASSSTENQNNNETSKNDTEITEENQNVELTAEEKIERARQLITLQRKQRLEEVQKKEREQEIQRRQMGRDVQKMRQMQQELQIKQAHEERMREKAAEVAAREKVRQQIAQDKLERKQKELALQQQVQQQNQSQKQLKQSSVPTTATMARIQFRLPSGNSYTGQFEPSSTLRALRTYVIENIDLPFREFVMSTSFPRRELTNEENDKTLLELELVPTAVILILPLKNSNVTKAITSTQDVGFFSRLIWSFVTPIIHIYNYIIDYFSGTTGEANRRHNNSSNDSTELMNNPERDISPNRGNVVQPSGLFRRYLSNQGGATIRAQGNVHRLHSGGDDNDENNTWNGNSTQQM
ncbi:hypothetical protein HN011_012157 [Eciton burchellii]|nr:hypothetical protein HN011_012157 [Eciton burchellii]